MESNCLQRKMWLAMFGRENLQGSTSRRINESNSKQILEMKKIELVCMQKAKGYIQKADACILLQV